MQSFTPPENSRLRWYAGQTILREHKFSSAPLAATACTFEQPDSSCLAVLEADRVSVYAQDGAVYSVALSRKPRALWPLHRGIVLEPEYTTGAGETPPLLLLERALDEPQPIDASAVGGVSSSSILLSDAPRSQLLAYDAVRQRHILWAVLGEAG